jgi:uncharacterized surface protein with fasciclin (FAS1) repeats
MKPIHILTFCLLFFTLASCRKKEFMPEVEGQPVPHPEITASLKEVLNTSPYTIFKAAWERSNMDKIMKEKGDRANYTVLVPTNEAFIADGLTMEKINSTEPALLDSILLYHTLTGAFNPEDLKGRVDNYPGKSLLENPYLRVKAPFPGAAIAAPYFYLQYLKVSGDELFVNGKNAGAAAAIPAKNGVILPVNRVLHKPTKTILEVLQEDGRFGMYLDLTARTDALFAELTYGAFLHDFTDGLKVRELGDYNITFHSIFAITDDAFRKAGYQTVDEMMELNNRSPLPYVDWDTYAVKGGLVTDTLVGYHRWGTYFSHDEPNMGRGTANATNFYSNDLNNTVLWDYTLVIGGYPTPFPAYKMPLDFNNEGGVIKVKVKGSDYPAASVIESDINTIMGPVHIVDRLLLPKGFKL